MRRGSAEYWGRLHKGLLELVAKTEEEQASRWNSVVEDRIYFGAGMGHLHDAQLLFALGEMAYAEQELAMATRCLEKAIEVDDLYWYGKMYDRIAEEVFDGRTYTVSTYADAQEDGVEPWHDEELGRAMRAEMLFACRWLKEGIRDLALLRQALQHMKAWFNYQSALPQDSPEANRQVGTIEGHLPEFLQWCVEIGDFELAKGYSREYVGRPLSGTPVGWKFTRDAEAVYYLLAVHLSGERDLSQLFPEAIDRCYRWTCRQIGQAALDYTLDDHTLLLAFRRAQMLGLPTEPRELLRRIREDS